MLNKERLERQLRELPLYAYFYFSTEELIFSPRIRWICQNECPMYGKTWACPPGVGTVAECEEKCRSYANGLVISTIVEVEDISDIEASLETRRAHEDITDQVGELFREQGITPYILSTEACAICQRCAILDGKPCRHPERMHPCVESQGLVVSQLAEEHGLPFQYGGNIITWFSFLLYNG